MTSKTEQTTRTVELIDAVQGNAGVGLTRGDIDRIVALYRGDAWNTRGQIANVLDPDSAWTHTKAVGRTEAILDALRAYDGKYPDARLHWEMQECRCVVSCADDPASACSLSGIEHTHPDDGSDTFGPCPVHPDAPGDR